MEGICPSGEDCVKGNKKSWAGCTQAPRESKGWNTATRHRHLNKVAEAADALGGPSRLVWADGGSRGASGSIDIGAGIGIGAGRREQRLLHIRYAVPCWVLLLGLCSGGAV